MDAPTTYAEAQRLCYLACQHYGLSAAATEYALDAAKHRWKAAHRCYLAIENSLTWGR